MVDGVFRQEAIDRLDQGDTCFAAGTLVHTKSGLKPIEEIEIDDWVLTFPDTQTPLDRKRREDEYIYRQVTQTFKHEDNAVTHVTVFDLAAGVKETLRVTPNHPFYVEGGGWTKAANLTFGSKLTNSVFGNLLVTKVKHAVERTSVFNIEVEDCHTYYVGDTAVWVHNHDCTKQEALGDAMERAQIEGECFVGNTLVWVEPWADWVTGERREKVYIEEIEVGDEVLSRCEITGEMAYKKVTKVFAHGDAKVSVIGCNFGPEHYAKFEPKAGDYAILATANHPFWVEGKGWTKVRDLQAGDEFLTHNGVKATFRIANLDAYEDEVYNFEVEDFHTYFVESAGIWVHNKSHGNECGEQT
jgi:hypothetical protein